MLMELKFVLLGIQLRVVPVVQMNGLLSSVTVANICRGLSIDNSMSVSGKRMVKVAEEITADPSSYNFVGFDYVLVALGVNACQATGESGIGLFSSAIDTIENKIKADKAVPIFATPYRYLTLSQTGNGNETTNQKDLPFFQQTLRERCAANGYALAEVADAMGDSAGSPGGFDSTGFMNAWTTDNIHANTRGQLAIASAFFSALSASSTLNSSKPVTNSFPSSF